MLNNAWPSLHWHLYDYFLNPAGAYFGAQLANEPLHIQYSPDARAVVLVNHTLAGQRGLQAGIRVRNLAGEVTWERHLQGLALGGNATRQVATLPATAGPPGVYFIELELTGAHGEPVSRNVYWLPSQTDEPDWAHSNWYLTPVTRYADLTALQSLPPVASEVQASLRPDGAGQRATVTLSLPATARGVALFQHVLVRASPGGAPVTPVLWSGNDITLWPGESVTLTARFAAAAGSAPVIEVTGWNTPARSVPLAAQASARASLSDRPVRMR
jgi:exo-1,4-beta-D-glucosaminidase